MKKGFFSNNQLVPIVLGGGLVIVALVWWRLPESFSKQNWFVETNHSAIITQRGISNSSLQQEQEVQVLPETVDAESFEPLAYEWSSDKNTAYFRLEPVPNIDPQTLTVINSELAKDKNGVYAEWYDNDSESSAVRRIPEADVATFEVVTAESGLLWYAKDKDTAFPQFNALGYEFIEGIDTNTFEYVGTCKCAGVCGRYFKDANAVYVDAKQLGGVDPESFVFYGTFESYFSGIPETYSYAQGPETVYYDCGEMLAGADASTFRMLGDGYARDISHVYYLGREIAGVDIGSFEMLGRGFSRDNTAVYIGTWVLEGADRDSFEVISYEDQYGNKLGYGKDKNYVYSRDGDVIEGVNPVDCTIETIESCKK